MFNRIKKLFGNTETARSKPGFRPCLENLEMREVPSASSGSIHAVSPNPADPYSVGAFYINTQNHLLDVGSFPINGAKGDPIGIKSLSAGHDANGFADVFATDKSGNLWKWTEGTWTKIKSASADTTESFAAVDGGRVFAILQNTTTKNVALEEYNGSSWSTIPGTGAVTAIDAVTDTSGRDTVFALHSDGSFWDYIQYNPGSSFYTDEQFVSTRFSLSQIVNFSAGLTSYGSPEAYAIFKSKFGTVSLEKITEGASQASWEVVTGATAIESYSATDNGAVWVDDATHGMVYELDQYGHIESQTELNVGSSPVELSAADSTDLYMVSSNKELSEFVDYPGFSSWIENQLTNPGIVQL